MTNKNAFSDYTNRELIKIAEEFAVEVNPAATKAEIVARLAEDGVEFSLYKTLHPEEFGGVVDVVEAEPVVVTTTTVVQPVVPVADKVLLKMTRKNATYESRGAKFTRENPFALVNEEDAEYLVNVIGGFQPALKMEAANYYK
jgi:hypothetical protein